MLVSILVGAILFAISVIVVGVWLWYVVVNVVIDETTGIKGFAFLNSPLILCLGLGIAMYITPGTLRRQGTRSAITGNEALYFLAALLPPGQDERTTLWTSAAGERFKTTGTAVIDPGWRAALEPTKQASENEGDEDADANAVIPRGLQSGDTATVLDRTVKDKKTKPPARFTDASLLALMEKYGLGTPATRARILEVLLTREYVRRDKKTLVSTDKGQHLLHVLPDTLKSPDLTGDWEARLEAIADAADDPRAFLGDIRQLTQAIVDAARHQTGEGIQTPSGFGTCPVCQTGEVRETAKGWGCSRWKEGCKFVIWKTVAHKKLTAAQVKTLLAGKTTSVLKGFKSNAGKPFEAQLKLDGPDKRVTFVFPPRATAAKSATATTS